MRTLALALTLSTASAFLMPLRPSYQVRKPLVWRATNEKADSQRAAQDAIDNVGDQAKQTGREVADKTQSFGQDARESIENAGDSARNAWEDVKEGVKDATQDAKEQTRESSEVTKDTLKGATDQAKDAGQQAANILKNPGKAIQEGLKQGEENQANQWGTMNPEDNATHTDDTFQGGNPENSMPK